MSSDVWMRFVGFYRCHRCCCLEAFRQWDCWTWRSRWMPSPSCLDLQSVCAAASSSLPRVSRYHSSTCTTIGPSNTRILCNSPRSTSCIPHPYPLFKEIVGEGDREREKKWVWNTKGHIPHVVTRLLTDWASWRVENRPCGFVVQQFSAAHSIWSSRSPACNNTLSEHLLSFIVNSILLNRKFLAVDPIVFQRAPICLLGVPLLNYATFDHLCNVNSCLRISSRSVVWFGNECVIANVQMNDVPLDSWLECLNCLNCVAS